MAKPPATAVNGHRAETAARKHLEKTGLKTLEQNYRGRFGEIDLIMRDGPVVAFVEVRFRSNNHILDAAETIDMRKCDRIIKTAMQYMQTLKKPDSHCYRFDVITLTGSLENPTINWIRNAFQA